jgi:hypothetical protein
MIRRAGRVIEMMGNVKERRE